MNHDRCGQAVRDGLRWVCYGDGCGGFLVASLGDPWRDQPDLPERYHRIRLRFEPSLDRLPRDHDGLPAFGPSRHQRLVGMAEPRRAARKRSGEGRYTLRPPAAEVFFYCSDCGRGQHVRLVAT